MADRIKLRRGPKNKIDLNIYELGYATDSTEKRLYFNDGSMVPIPNEKDITDIKAELTEATNISNQNKQDVSELKESVAGIIKTGVAKLVQYSYDIELSETTQKVNIPYERYSSITDTLKVYVNGLAIQNDQYTITDPVENDGIVTNGYIVLKVERPAGTIVRIEVWKNVPSGEEGEVSGNIISQNSLPLNRIIGIDDITSKLNDLNNDKADKTELITIEEGEWTPVIQGGVHTYETQYGHYIKQGKVVTVTFRIKTTAINKTIANNVDIKGLPFVNLSKVHCEGVTIGFLNNIDMSNLKQILAVVAGNRILLRGVDLTGVSKTPTLSMLSDRFEIYGSATYITE